MIASNHNTNTILIIEPATSGLNYLSAAKSLGLTVYVFSANSDERVIEKYYQQWIDYLIVVDTNKLDAMLIELKKLLQKTTLAAIIPGFEIFVGHAARLASYAGLLAPPDKTIDALRNKLLARTILANHSVQSPRFAAIASDADINKAIETVEFPAVLKPMEQSGSIHVSKVEDARQLKEAYCAMCEDRWTEMAKGIGDQALLESYLDGPEYSVEGFIKNGRVTVIAITEKQLGEKPYFVEMGHIIPANLSDETQNAICQYTRSVIHALQMKVGAFHCELKLTSQNGPVLVEIAGRLAGDHIGDLIQLATGVNFYQQVLLAYLQQATLDELPSPNKQAAICFFAPSNTGYLKEIQGINNLKALQGFVEFKQIYQTGDYIPPLTAFNGRVAYAIFCCDSEECLRQSMRLAHEIITIQVTIRGGVTSLPLSELV